MVVALFKCHFQEKYTIILIFPAVHQSAFLFRYVKTYQVFSYDVTSFYGFKYVDMSYNLTSNMPLKITQIELYTSSFHLVNYMIFNLKGVAKTGSKGFGFFIFIILIESTSCLNPKKLKVKMRIKSGNENSKYDFVKHFLNI